MFIVVVILNYRFLPKDVGCTKGTVCKCAPLNKHTYRYVVQKQKNHTIQLQVQKQSPLNKERDLVKQKMAKYQLERKWFSYL